MSKEESSVKKIENALVSAGKPIISNEAWLEFETDSTVGSYGFLTIDGMMDFLRGVKAAREPGFRIKECSTEQYHVKVPEKYGGVQLREEYRCPDCWWTSCKVEGDIEVETCVLDRYRCPKCGCSFIIFEEGEFK